jgi:hypothetical protein
MKLDKILFISLTTIVLIACSNQTDSNKETMIKTDDSIAMEQANWFLGSWQNKTSDGDFTEIWRQKNDSVYLGVSYVIVEKDTVFYELISLEQKNKKWNYCVSVKNQNNEQRVSFELTSMTSNQLVFENSKHDFPSKITYTKITQDSMVAKISGIIKSEEQTENFPMKRSN